MAQLERLAKQAIRPVEKLTLQRGDILIVHDLVTLNVLRGTGVPGVDWPVPILLIPEGGLEVAHRQMLLDALSILDTIPTQQEAGSVQ